MHKQIYRIPPEQAVAACFFLFRKKFFAAFPGFSAMALPFFFAARLEFQLESLFVQFLYSLILYISP